MQLTPSDIEIDDEADAAYVRVSAASVARTREIAEGILVDFDADDQVTGVEILGLGKRVGSGDRVSYLNGLVAGLLLGPVRTAAE
jgi:uncharacterized protein YuzE